MSALDPVERVGGTRPLNPAQRVQRRRPDDRDAEPERREGRTRRQERREEPHEDDGLPHVDVRA